MRMRFVEWNIIFTVRIRSTYFRSTAANQLPSVQCSVFYENRCLSVFVLIETKAFRIVLKKYAKMAS